MGGYENMEEIEIFGTEIELSEYTLVTGKIFPRERAKYGTILWTLLRRIKRPPAADTRRDENNTIIEVSGAAEGEEGSDKKVKRRRSRKNPTGGAGDDAAEI